MPLKSPHAGTRHDRAQIGVFARAFDDAAPAGIAGDVHHRREGPSDAGRPRFSGRDAGGPFDGHGIPTARFRKRHGEDRPIAVQDIEAEKKRDLQSRLLDGDPLQFVHAARSPHVEERAHEPTPHEVEMIGAIRAIHIAIEHLKLPELLFERHLPEQGVNLALDLIGGRRGGNRYPDQKQDAHQTDHPDRALAPSGASAVVAACVLAHERRSGIRN